MGGSAIGAFGQMGAALITADKERSARQDERRASEKAAATEREYSEQAKMDIISRMVPAMADYMDAMYEAGDIIRSGEADVMQILQQTTGDARGILAQSGIDAERAIMGNMYMSQGVPYSQFQDNYAQIQQLPPEQQQAAMGQMLSDIGADPAQFAADLGTTPEAIGMTQNASGQWVSAEPIPQIGYSGARYAIETGMDQASQALQQGFGAATAETTAGEQAALERTALGREELQAAREAGLGYYQPYGEAGQAAIQQEAALSGAMGPEAQQAAIDAFIESPGQKYLREQQEKSLLRNQAAIGGLGGGRIRTALQEQAMGIAATQQQQQLENLRSLATRGQEVAGAQAGIQTGTAANLANVYGQEAQITQQAAQQRAQLAQALGVGEAEIDRLTADQISSLAQQTGLQLAALQQNQAQKDIALVTQLGGSTAELMQGTNQALAGLTERGAGNILTQEQNIANLIQGLTSGTGTNLANIALGEGASAAASQQRLGEILGSGIKGIADIGASAYEQKYGGSSGSGLTSLAQTGSNVQGFGNTQYNVPSYNLGTYNVDQYSKY